MVYEPQEDSFLLKEFVKQHVKGVVLDMGTGSGLQAREAAHSKRTSKIFAVDIDKKAIAYCKEYSNHKRHKKITWVVGDLFSPFKEKKYLHFFDTIIFNPPYLPQDHKVRDITTEGGKRGHETIERFLDDVNNYLKPDGLVLLVFSSLTPEVHNILERNMLVGKELGRTHMFFEDIFVYLIKRSALLNELEKKGVCNLRYFAKGKRGYVFTGKYNDKKVAVKIKHPGSSVDTLLHESNMLRLVNKHGIGPKYLFHSQNYLVYEFVEGRYLRDFVGRKAMKSICKKVFEQCYQLDLIGVNKEEMSNPYKHVIIGKRVVLIDFERARKAEDVHNVTQFCNYVMHHGFNSKKWIKLAMDYSRNPSRAQLQRMLAVLSG